jgi:hypothetical protein
MIPQIVMKNVNSLWRYFKHLRSPGIDSKESIPPAYVARAGIFKQSMGARNRLGIGLWYRPARLHSTQPGGNGSLESIHGLLKSL